MNPRRRRFLIPYKQPLILASIALSDGRSGLAHMATCCTRKPSSSILLLNADRKKCIDEFSYTSLLFVAATVFALKGCPLALQKNRALVKYFFLDDVFVLHRKRHVNLVFYFITHVSHFLFVNNLMNFSIWFVSS